MARRDIVSRRTEEGQGHRCRGKRAIVARGSRGSSTRRKKEDSGRVWVRWIIGSRDQREPPLRRRPPWQLGGTNRCHSPLTYPNLALETETDRPFFPSFARSPPSPPSQPQPSPFSLPFVLVGFIIFLKVFPPCGHCPLASSPLSSFQRGNPSFHLFFSTPFSRFDDSQWESYLLV